MSIKAKAYNNNRSSESSGCHFWNTLFNRIQGQVWHGCLKGEKKRVFEADPPKGRRFREPRESKKTAAFTESPRRVGRSSGVNIEGNVNVWLLLLPVLDRVLAVYLPRGVLRFHISVFARNANSVRESQAQLVPAIRISC